MIDTSEYLTTAQVAKQLKRSQGTLRRWRCQGIGPVYVSSNSAGGGSRVFYERKAVEAYMKGTFKTVYPTQQRIYG